MSKTEHVARHPNKQNSDESDIKSSPSQAADVENVSEPVKSDLDDKKSLTQKVTKIILIIAAIYFVWYLVSDRITPITDQARVRAFVIPIVPQVSGVVSEIEVAGDSIVKQGDVLFKIDPRDYQFAVEQAQANLELAGQEVGANTASVAAAKASYEKSKSNLNTKQIEAARVMELEKIGGAVSKRDVNRARGAVDEATIQVRNQLAAYQQAQQVLGKQGQDNPKILKALSELSTAQLNLERTTLKAPYDGVASNARINKGYYASKGQKVMSFISAQHAWIEASYRENNLGNMNIGDEVDIALDSAPGRIFKGEVASIGYGASFDKAAPGDLAKPEKPKGWMRDPQRFTVFIRFKDEQTKGLRREGGQATVLTYTSDNVILNGLAKLSIWMSTYVSYVQ